MDENDIITGDTRAKSNIEETEKLVEERKKKLINFLKTRQIWVIGVLIIAIILGVYIRSLPMQDHNPNVPGNQPGLWDIATNTWTLGPDLDPWLFTRYAQTIVERGNLPKVDYMRNVPLGFDTSIETQLLPYMIVWVYYILNLFGDYSVMFAAVIFPVILFALTIISFFLFVREIFIRKTKEEIIRANIIASISTFFMIIVPAFLSRTVAGIPEKESAAFFFMFFAFYFFLKGWKSEKNINSIILGSLAGISTAFMSLIWGGGRYAFVTIAVATLAAFILNKCHKKEFMLYLAWIIFSFVIPILFSGKNSLMGMITSLDTGLAFVVLIILLIHSALWKTKISKIGILEKIKLPNNITSLIITILLVVILTSILFGPSFLILKAKAINQIFFTPVTGRWNITVAENRQPYFIEWRASFGPFIRNIPILFWLFFIGSAILFKKMLDKIKKKDAWILTGLYVLFFCGLVFSRYSSSSIFNGENFISKTFYYGSALLLIGFLVYYYLKYSKEGNKSFEYVDYEYLLLFSLLALCLLTARGAVRLIMVLAPIAPIFLGYLVVESIMKFRKTNDEIMKVVMGAVVAIILILSFFVFFGNPVTKTPGFYQEIKGQAYSYIPSSYNQQWQKAMQWVREETPKEAIFAHWWDYGYWLQSIGNRATVLDGGNAIAYWNYLMGRLVLTGDNQKDALEFLYNHNATHLLIDSSDIGKYGAFSSIGSNENYDRYSWIGAFLLDEKQTQETKNQTTYFYPGGLALDEDLIINESGSQVLIPKGNSGIGAILIPLEKKGESSEFKQPYVIAVYQGKQYRINLRYLYINGQSKDFESGIEAYAFVFPTIIPQNGGVTSNPIGAAIFISPRLMRGMLSNIYFLNDPLKNYSNFKLVHSEANPIVESLNQQGMNLPEFIYYQGIQGPIKIWEIEYTGNEKIKQEYLDMDPTKYLSWKL